MKTPSTPWGLRMATNRLPHGIPSYDTVTLDPDTQMAVYRDAAGTIIEMGKHGTNRDVATATMSGQPDGGGGAPPQETRDDNTTDHEDD